MVVGQSRQGASAGCESDRDFGAPSGVTVDGRYELVHELGRGATGTVWAAHDAVTGEVRALKLLNAGSSGSASGAVKASKRFVRAIQTTQRLRHPHCVSVLAHGLTQDG